MDSRYAKVKMKSTKKWGRINWFIGKEKHTFKHEALYDLLYPYYKQAIWFEDQIKLTLVIL